MFQQYGNKVDSAGKEKGEKRKAIVPKWCRKTRMGEEELAAPMRKMRKHEEQDGNMGKDKEFTFKSVELK